MCAPPLFLLLLLPLLGVLWFWTLLSFGWRAASRMALLATGKGKGKGSGTFSKTYVNPALTKDAAGAVGGGGAGGSAGGGGDAATPAASAAGTTTVVPLGKGKGGKGKGKGKGGPAATFSKVWERSLTKDEGLLTPR